MNSSSPTPPSTLNNSSINRSSISTGTSSQTSTTVSSSKIEMDGRYNYEKQCTPLACAFEHCFQQHKYQMVPACSAKLDLYTKCVDEAKQNLLTQ